MTTTHHPVKLIQAFEGTMLLGLFIIRASYSDEEIKALVKDSVGMELFNFFYLTPQANDLT